MNRFTAYTILVLAYLAGAGSLLLFGVFLVRFDNFFDGFSGFKFL